MHIHISNSGEQPIYEQIFSQIKNAILSGTLQDGAALPSMRFLAKELRVSVITTKRAYEELERNGLITSVTGKGSFVTTKDLDFVRKEHLKELQLQIKKILAITPLCNLSTEQLIQMIQKISEENENAQHTRNQ